MSHKDLDKKMTTEWVAAVADALLSRIILSETGGSQWLGDHVMSPDLILEISQDLLWHGIPEWDLFEAMEDCQDLDHLLERLDKDLGTFWVGLEGPEDWE